MKSLWLDTDPGFDDLVTWLLLERLPDHRLDGVSVVAGNAPLEYTLENARRISAFLRSTVPIYAGCSQPLLAPQVTSQHLLGETGLSSVGRSLPDERAPVQSQQAVDALREHLEATTGTTIVAIAPLTNLGRLLGQSPQVASHIEQIILMGGSTDRGNHTAAAEFNIFADPEAAGVVFSSGVPIHMFGLNLTRQVEVTRGHSDALRSLGTDRATTLADHLDFYLQIRSPDRSAPMPFHDPVTAAFLARPELFSEVPASVQIELDGTLTRGMTVCEFRAHRASPNAQVALSADGLAVMTHIMAELREFCSE